MAKKKFVRGSFTLDKNTTDLDTYYAKHKATIDGICEWADKVGMYVAFGTSDDDTYLCQYETVQFTKAMCSGLSNELKARLKAEWKSSVQLGYQAFGDCW